MFALRSLLSALLVASLALGAFAEEHAMQTHAMKTNKSPTMKVSIATHSHLNDATALINKNKDMSGQNLAITQSNIIGQQDDVLTTAEASLKPNSVATPSDLTLTGERDMLSSPDVEDTKDSSIEEQYRDFDGRIRYRQRFFYPHFRGGYYGWRYPVRYWNRFGPRYYGDVCPFSRVYGDYYYC